MASEYVYVGAHTQVLTSGATITASDHVAPGDLDEEGRDQWLIDEGQLIDVASFEPAKAATARQKGGDDAS